MQKITKSIMCMKFLHVLSNQITASLFGQVTFVAMLLVSLRSTVIKGSTLSTASEKMLRKQ